MFLRLRLNFLDFLPFIPTFLSSFWFIVHVVNNSLTIDFLKLRIFLSLFIFRSSFHIQSLVNLSFTLCSIVLWPLIHKNIFLLELWVSNLIFTIGIWFNYLLSLINRWRYVLMLIGIRFISGHFLFWLRISHFCLISLDEVNFERFALIDLFSFVGFLWLLRLWL